MHDSPKIKIKTLIESRIKVLNMRKIVTPS